MKCEKGHEFNDKFGHCPDCIRTGIQPEEIVIGKTTISEIKKEMRSRHSKPNSSFEKAIDNYVSENIKQQSTSEEIREAFKKEKELLTVIDHAKNHPSYRMGFESGYKTAHQKLQAEIEEVRDTYLEMGKRIKGIEKQKDILADKLYERNEEQKELKQQISELKPMVEKALRFYKDVLEDDGLRPYQEAEYAKLNWTVDNWIPKE